MLLLRLFALSTILAIPPALADDWTPPWQVWKDLRSLALLTPGEQVLLRSSYCPDGCRYDRHSEEDPRFIRVDGEEGVIFEEGGPGAITRIWMTSGFGTSVPLDPSIRIRFYLDGESTPRIELPLPELFNGETPPFLSPLAEERLGSSGGNINYVPIAYQNGCRVTLVGAEQTLLWYQFSYHRLPLDRPVASFTPDQDLSDWIDLMSNPGADPWPEGQGMTSEGEVILAPGGEQILFNTSQPGTITELNLSLEETAWASIRIRMIFDGETTLDLPATDLFAIGRIGDTPTRSLLLGANDQGDLYSYFPMPYHQSARITLYNAAPPESGGTTVGFRVRYDAATPNPASGLFGASLNRADPTTPGEEYTLLRLDRPGKWVGLFAELGSVGTLKRLYLEGDERVYLDGSRHPGIYGTGVEDFFNSGFYFDQGGVRLALHGMTYHLITPEKEDVTAAYRLMISDAIPFSNQIHAVLESGPLNDIAMRAHTVAYYYLGQKGLRLANRLDSGAEAPVMARPQNR